MTPDDEGPWMCGGCGQMTTVTHWAWPEGVAVHDPELAYLEAAGLAEQGESGQPTDGCQP